jgi:Flp pilus assembly protein TadD
VNSHFNHCAPVRSATDPRGFRSILREWLDARQSAHIGCTLADQFAPRVASCPTADANTAVRKLQATELRKLLLLADRQLRSLRLNFYKKARFATAFKCKLIENSVDEDRADELTHALVLHLSRKGSDSLQGHESTVVPTGRTDTAKAKYLLTLGNKSFAEGDFAEAVDLYQRLVELEPRHADALNNLGAAVCKLGRYKEGELHFRQAIAIKPDYPEAYCNLGTLLRWMGDFGGAEVSLRRALKLKPPYVDARVSLGLTLIFLGRLRDATVHLKKALKIAPHHPDALSGMGQIVKLEGRFDEAETRFHSALKVKPKMASVWAALAGIRKMTAADGDWLKGAQEIAVSGLAPLEEADIRFAIGKYCDDVHDFEQAFRNYQRANDLLKTVAESYDRDARTRFVDGLIRVYTHDAMSKEQAGACVSMKPVIVVGMMRSGTSLVEQIIASHPAAKGAGELAFWSDAVSAHEIDLRQSMPSAPMREKLAAAYLRVLPEHCGDALRIVDKAPVNSDHLGPIHSVFPHARIIYMQRDPIDSCLSCYFQQFSIVHNFTMDLNDLAHYYREHQRLMAHWRAVLPPGSILEVPYAELVADPATWTRKILDFLGLEWDDRCLNFHKTKRPVATASTWQVRQKIYKDSVDRWRNYQKFLGPLRALQDSSGA